MAAAQQHIFSTSGYEQFMFVAMRWTNDHDTLLCSRFATASRDDLRQLFPECTDAAIQIRANKLGLKRAVKATIYGDVTPWSDEEMELLRQRYPEVRSAKKLLDEFPGRTVEAIKLQVRKLGLQQKQNPAVWTTEDDEKLRQLYPEGKNAALLTAFPDRNLAGIRKHACRLGVERQIREDLPEVKAAHAKRLRERPLRLGTSKSPIEVRDGVEGRVCLTCERFKPIKKFAVSATCSGGRRLHCTTCGGRTSYTKYRETCIRQVRAWQARHPEENKARQRSVNVTRKARIRAGGAEHITAVQLQQLVAIYEGRCGYCETAPIERFDHRTPIKRGGRHTLANLIPACANCNLRKGTLTYDEFMEKLARMTEKA